MSAQFLLLAILLLLSAFFSSMETAFFSVSIIRVRTLAKQGDRAARLIEKLRDDPRSLLGTLLIGNNLVNIGATALATVLTIELFGSAAVGLATGVITLVILVFGEFVPKSYAAHHSERLAFAMALPVYSLTRMFSPLVWALNAITSRLVRHDGPSAPTTVSEEEIKTMAQMAVTAGTVEKGEKELIERVFLFNDVTAYDVMTPREDVVYLDGSKPINQTLPLIAATEYSRYPVFGRDRNDILGVVHIKDIFERLVGDAPETTGLMPLREIAKPATFVPKTKPIDDLLREMQKQHVHMAMVVNEFGSIVGVVTFEDLIEELVGEIADESDVEEHFIKRIDRNALICHGEAEIKDLNRFFNVRIAAPEHRSIGWVILKELGSIPSVGQVVDLNEDLKARVEEMTNLRITKVRLIKIGDSAAAKE